MTARPRQTGDEKDYLDPAIRRHFAFRAGERKAVKTRYSRKDRRQARTVIRDSREG